MRRAVVPVVLSAAALGAFLAYVLAQGGREDAVAARDRFFADETVMAALAPSSGDAPALGGVFFPDGRYVTGAGGGLRAVATGTGVLVELAPGCYVAPLEDIAYRPPPIPGVTVVQSLRDVLGGGYDRSQRLFRYAPAGSDGLVVREDLDRLAAEGVVTARVEGGPGPAGTWTVRRAAQEEADAAELVLRTAEPSPAASFSVRGEFVTAAEAPETVELGPFFVYRDCPGRAYGAVTAQPGGALWVPVAPFALEAGGEGSWYIAGARALDAGQGSRGPSSGPVAVETDTVFALEPLVGGVFQRASYTITACEPAPWFRCGE